MKRKLTLIFLSIVCALCLCFGLTACGGNSDDNDDSKQNTEQTGGGENDNTDETTTPVSTYTVTYNANGGTFTDGSETYTQTVNSGSTLTAPTSPTKDGCSFIGWTTSINGSITWQFSSNTVTANITLYASWNEQSATILSVDGATIDGEDIFMLVDSDTESVSLSTKVVCSSNSIWKLYYDKLGYTEIPTKTAASSTGSLYNGENTYYIIVTSTDGTQVNVYTITVYRSYEITVTYYNGEEALNTETAYTGYAFNSNYIPEIEGYSFNYWNTSTGSKYTKETLWDNLSLYADKTANDYTITYDVNGGDELASTTKTVTYDSSYTLAVPERTGYSFSGWYYGSAQLTDEEGKSLAVWSYADDTTITAKWTANDYIVTLNLSNSSAGTVTGDGEHAYDSSVTIKATTNDGYTWLGWYDKNGELVSANSSYTFTMGFDVTYTAKWTYYTLTTSANNSSAGSVTSYSNTKITAGNSVTIKATTNNGYTFVGWYNGDTQLSTSLSYTITMPSEDITYTAKFELNFEMSNFKFTSTATTCKITGLNDKTVTEIVVPDYVTSISGGAFSGCSNLISISLPFVGGSVKTSTDTYQYPFGYIFGTSGYTGGTATTQKYYGLSTSSTTSTTYYIPTTLTTVVITGGNILYGAFYNCTSLESITIPDSITSIGSTAFYGCTKLTSIIIPDSVTSIGSAAFSGCTKLTSIIIGDSVTSIGNSTFYNCTALESIIIGDSVTSIDNYAFYNCTSLTNVSIGNSVTSIDDYAFSNCTSLTYNEYENGYYLGNGSNNYLILAGVTDMSISSLTINTNTKIIYGAFDGCTSLTSITIPDSVTTIGHRAFSNCTSLNRITIPDSVTTIGNYAFSGCRYLTKITIGSGVATIGDYAFYYCDLLTSITIPKSVTSIGYNAFYYCGYLTSIVFEDTTTWYYTSLKGATSGTTVSSMNASTMATYLTDTYRSCYWYKK